MINKEELCVILPSHDSYIDLVELFIRQFEIHWADCPFSIIWSNCNQQFSNKKVIVINNGADSSFCTRIINAMSITDAKYILLTLEDYILIDDVNQNRINNLLSIMSKYNLSYCRLNNSVVRSRVLPFKYEQNIFEFKHNAPYGISIGVGIFERDFLLNLIKDKKWSGWELENHCLNLANDKMIKGCIYDAQRPFNNIHLIIKGKIIPKSANILSNLGIDISGIKRDYLSTQDRIRIFIFRIASRIVPQKFRQYLKCFLNKIGIKTVTKY